MLTKILVPLDGSALAEQAIEPAVAMAGRVGATLVLVQVHKPIRLGGFEDAPWNFEEEKVEQLYLKTIEQEVAASAAIPVTSVWLRGDPSEKIAAHARAMPADLIVMTTHGRTGFSRVWLGSVAHALLRRSTVPILLVRASANTAQRPATVPLPRRILVTLDGSEIARGIIPAAVELARCTKGRLLLLRVVEPVPLPVTEIGRPTALAPVGIDEVATRQIVAEATQNLSCLAASLANDRFTDVETDVIVASGVAQAILDYAESSAAEAITMSTHGRGLSRLFVGSVADKVLRASGLPMLLQRPLEAHSQVRFLEDAGAEQVPALAAR